MSTKEKMIEDFLKELNGYFMQLSYLKDMISVKTDMSLLKEKMQHSPNFTLTVECALSDGYTLALMRLYDKSKETKTIPNLIEKCKENIHLFESKEDTKIKLEEFEAKLKDGTPIAKAIEILKLRRDTYYVHNDNKYFGEKLQEDKSYLPMYVICELRDFTEEVLEYLHSQLSQEEHRQTRYDKDLKNLFENYGKQV